jgi:Arc/MetJ-type ribon-helix-helix transcriptional regulator
MALTLTPEQEALVERIVREGRYASQDEALSAALSLLAKQDVCEDQREETKRLRERYPTLVDLFADSPFKGLDLEFPRDPSPLRDVDL